MTTPEFQQFEDNVEYVRGLIKGGHALEAIRSTSVNLGDLATVHPDDLYRAAWVQGVSALDYWLHREIIKRAIALVNDTGRQRPESLKKLRIPFDFVDRMRREPRDRVLREYLELFLGYESLQKPDKIQEGLRIVVPRTSSSIWTEIADMLGRTPSDVKKCQIDIVNRRNQIAHEADLLSNGSRRPITEAETTAAVDWIVSLAHAVANVLG